MIHLDYADLCIQWSAKVYICLRFFINQPKPVFKLHFPIYRHDMKVCGIWQSRYVRKDRQRFDM